MHSHFLYKLLGIWLLLIQFPRGTPGQRKRIYKVCGPFFDRFLLNTCRSLQVKRTEIFTLQIPALHTTGLTHRAPKSDPSFFEKRKSTIFESQPSLRELQQLALKDANLNSEELPTRSHDAEDNENNNHSEFNNFVSEKYLRKKKTVPKELKDKCCKPGCRKVDVFDYC